MRNPDRAGARVDATLIEAREIMRAAEADLLDIGRLLGFLSASPARKGELHLLCERLAAVQKRLTALL